MTIGTRKKTQVNNVMKTEKNKKMLRRKNLSRIGDACDRR